MRTSSQTRITDDAAIALQCLNELEHDYVAARPRSSDTTEASRATHRVDCPVCAATMVVRSAEPLPTIVEMDCATHRLGCTHCGMLTDRIFHCDFGYAPFPI